MYQEGGDHYRRMKIQPIEFTLANGLGFCEGNIIKYVCRWRHKNGIQDLKKARQYLAHLIEQAEIEEAEKPCWACEGSEREMVNFGHGDVQDVPCSVCQDG